MNLAYLKSKIEHSNDYSTPMADGANNDRGSGGCDLLTINLDDTPINPHAL